MTATEPATKDGRKYHHGDLPAALRAATAELVAERGPVGFSLREVARRAGVSHAAPAHHFGDSKGLLTAVAIEGFTIMCQTFEEQLADIEDPVERLTALGKAYVNVARNRIGHFAVMWADALIDTTNEQFVEVATRAFGYLEDTVSAVAAAHNPELDIEAASVLAWSAVHGLAMLHCRAGDVAPGPEWEVDLDRRVDQFSELFLNGFAKR